MKTCNTCKHSLFESVPDTPACNCYCKKHYTIDPVTGFKIYDRCKYININGNCQDHELSNIRKLWIKVKEKIVKSLSIF